RRAYVYATPLTRDDRAVGALVVILDAAHLEGAAWNLWWSNALRFLALALVVSLIALVVVRSSVTQPMAKMSEWTKSLRAGRYVPPPDVPDANVFGPLAREVAGLARSMQRARAAAEQEAALRLVGESIWTEERLKQFVNLRLAGRPLVVVSNREPVSHVRKGGRIQTLTPASGLVTAMDPMMRACGGVWVAHGSGDADRETADARGRLGVPEDDPRYTLRRVWLTKEEEHGYYYGFANEGLWPLCHIVHTRPVFRPDDWAHYLAANRTFAETRLDWERFTVTRGERVTAVKPFPISVAPGFVDDPLQRTREELLRELGVSAEFLGVGVERVDYTKGLPERFRALRWFFERYPEYRGRVVFVQLAEPSRSTIKRYAELALEVEQTVREVSEALGIASWRPILYLARHHEHREIWSYYR